MILLQGRRRAFSLIEAAIVLGIIGLVIGGIWAATNEVRQRNKANRAAENILFMVDKARRMYPPTEYPAACCTSGSITGNAVQAGVIPRDWVSGTTMITEYGRGTGNNGISLGNYTTYGQTMAIQIAGREGGYTTGMTQAECNALIGAFASRFKNGNNFIYLQIVQNDAAHVFLYAPIAISTIACPADFLYLNFWFRPT